MFARVFLILVSASFLTTVVRATEQPTAPPPAETTAKVATESSGKRAATMSGAKQAAFKRVSAEWRELLTELVNLDQKHVAAGAEEKREIEKRYDELVKQGEALRVKLERAAEEAYVESPGADPDATSLIQAICHRDFLLENYEEVSRLSGVLIAHDVKDEHFYVYGGVAAFCIGDLATAEKYLNAAAKMSKKGTEILQTKKGDLLDQLVLMFQHDPREQKKAWQAEQKIRAAEAKTDDLPRVLLKTSQGDIELELFENEAPNTVANFISLIEKGFYNDLTFHRVLERFMAQGGCPQGTGQGGPGYEIPSEARQPNHRQHFRGSISMALGSTPDGDVLYDSGGSQFFITFIPTTSLDGSYTVFGRVVKGMDVLSKIQRRNPDDAKEALPAPDRIIDAKVLRKRDHAYVPKKVAQ